MTHFVSKSCGGEKCSLCLKPATHKVGEEIPHDEPCLACGFSWKQAIDKPSAAERLHNCNSLYHIGAGVPRHNLTAYVCCACFTRILGSATGCPLTDAEKEAQANWNYAHQGDDPGFGRPMEIRCPACEGPATATGFNIDKTLMFIDCDVCGLCSEVKFAERDHVPKKT